ncbi:MAG: glycosyltransferase family 2 protein [Candidatus Portnoybacteria bacterium CG10_big_fil_rev_8_21_14_0_10_36_7]|uniref:Glycosyltransferase family 2 protein n=1 Tax=Candidatus Portnoybacteria bacterium CG10_big_fil_rev_8_21_14_0_10_36_7 TaxID=1974812 RepID=A0A2M8KDB4_9BACT|nr:MAG: glycosyltransferase family 2 protein [Candidatus Portnoybacteria bacterium CG10_big_fil_rev_8_21_14_0_10_36_7]
MERFSLPYVVVFIPAYNECKTIDQVIKIIKTNYQGKNQKDYVVDIIVIDDGSKDDTATIAKAANIRKVVSHPQNKGLGAATRTGMESALEIGADIAVKIDADLQNDPKDIETVVRPILNDRADCVFGSRLMGGLQYKMPIYRKIGNKFFAWLVSKIVGMKITDATTGLMAFHKRYLKSFNIIKNYNETQQLIIDSWGKHMRIMEVSTTFHQRQTGKSFIRMRLKYPSIVLPTMFRMYIHFKPLRFFVYTGLTLIITGIAMFVYISSYGETFFGDATISVLIIVGFQIVFFGLLADQISFTRKR